MEDWIGARLHWMSSTFSSPRSNSEEKFSGDGYGIFLGSTFLKGPWELPVARKGDKHAKRTITYSHDIYVPGKREWGESATKIA